MFISITLTDTDKEFSHNRPIKNSAIVIVHKGVIGIFPPPPQNEK
jgi:hypothetical protein